MTTGTQNIMLLCSGFHLFYASVYIYKMSCGAESIGQLV
jgi:hypothetical protein